jgi:hypothetical protein
LSQNSGFRAAGFAAELAEKLSEELAAVVS